MKQTVFLKGALPLLAVALLGAGCLSSVPPSQKAASAPTPTSTVPDAPKDRPLVRLDSLLGIRFPTQGRAVFEDSSVPKQEGALFYGSAYRITKSAEEYDRLFGRIQVLNLTDPYKGPRNLEEPMRVLLGCVGLDANFGPTCDFGAYATTSVDGLEVRTYPVAYFPHRQNDDETFVTTTVWLIPTPGNDQAWLYVYPARVKDAFLTPETAGWVGGLERE